MEESQQEEQTASRPHATTLAGQRAPNGHSEHDHRSSEGSQPVVVLCGPKAIKEALIDNAEAFGGRGPMLALGDNIVKYGMITTNGERWRQLRRFAFSTLRNFGMGKKSIEERIQEEAQFLVEALEKTRGHPFDPTTHLNQAVANIICSVVFGNRFEYEDEKFTALLNLISQALQLFLSPRSQMKNFAPRLMRVLAGPFDKLSKCIQDLLTFVSQRIQAHRESFDPNYPRDFIDCFLSKMEQEKDNPASEFHDDNLVVLVLNLFFAGTEAVSTTLRYGLLILLRYPEIEAKVHEEIDRVIGRNRKPSMEDLTQMPYTNAVVHEIQRFGDFAPLGAPHSMTCDTQFQGYTIPKGTTVITFLTSALEDPHHFETPRKFNPGHFLDDNGAFKKNEAFLPFSTGKRVCLGEGLARMELFLFLTTVLQNLTLKTLRDQEEIDILPQIVGSGKRPLSYQLCMFPRP
ncbi:cytochrome P450 2C42-like isoform X2 [Sceloporus undulatus]|uniref:cytochrome P450 2C42-like isoform X2 n=1 Tax=Sceloporus undulatus TaxID=8520 RepID=UPI001C4AD141|nr:cytochrome P450 2C42-like isoform X2 [Sceloporus undulatus]XP_042299644.1 cytochrome P450 2C42-like isoform X2 [Sceloporus undulatus]